MTAIQHDKNVISASWCRYRSSVRFATTLSRGVRKNLKEENGTCLESSLAINLETSLVSTDCVRSPGLLAAGLSLPGVAVAQETQYFPTYVTGPQPNGTWVVSNGQIINPAGMQVDLGIRVRAKAIALNPNLGTHTAAVLTLGTSTSDGNGAVEVFDTKTGLVMQNYVPFGVDSSGSYSGIAYSADGKHLVFSQDSSNVTVANVTAQGLLEDDAQVSVPPNNSFIACFPNSPPGSYDIPCGTFYTPSTSYPGGDRDLTGWQQRLRPVKPERYAHQDRPDHEPAGYADPRRECAPQRR